MGANGIMTSLCYFAPIFSIKNWRLKNTIYDNLFFAYINGCTYFEQKTAILVHVFDESIVTLAPFSVAGDLYDPINLFPSDKVSKMFFCQTRPHFPTRPQFKKSLKEGLSIRTQGDQIAPIFAL
jgi:hypothetical protein